MCREFFEDFNDVVGVRLRVSSTWESKSNQIHRRGDFASVGLPAEHNGSNFTGSNTANFVQRDRNGLPWIRQWGNVGQPLAGVNEHGVAASRLNDGDSQTNQPLDDVLVGPHSIAQIVFIHDFFEPLSQGFHVATGHSTVGSKSFGANQVSPSLFGQFIIVERQPATNIAESVLLCTHRHHVGIGKAVSYDFSNGAILLTGFTLFDKPSILSKATSVDDQWTRKLFG